jgi:hypothetical protein
VSPALTVAARPISDRASGGTAEMVAPPSTTESATLHRRSTQSGPIAVNGPTVLSSTTVPAPMTAGPSIRERTTRAPASTTTCPVRVLAASTSPATPGVKSASSRRLQSSRSSTCPVSFQ